MSAETDDASDDTPTVPRQNIYEKNDKLQAQPYANYWILFYMGVYLYLAIFKICAVIVITPGFTMHLCLIRGYFHI